MNIHEIKHKAEQEQEPIKEIIKHIKELHKTNPNGTDFIVKEEFIPALIAYCDHHHIPIYEVAENCCSTATTYGKLYAHERMR